MHAGALRALEYDRIVEAVRRFAQTPPGAARLAKLQPLDRRARGGDRARGHGRDDALPARRRDRAAGARRSRRAADVARRRGPRARAAGARQPGGIPGLGRCHLQRRCARPAAAFPCSPRSPRPRRRSSTRSATSGARLARPCEVVDDASPELANLRDRLRKQRARLRGTLESYLRGRDTSKYLQQQIVTDRNGRYVLVVRSEHRTAIPGIVHGSSGSGASLFLEPLSTVEINNDIVALEQQEFEEVRRILLALADALRRRAADLHRTVDAATELDVLQARARFSLLVDGIQPALASDGRLELRAARHPLLIPPYGGIWARTAIGSGSGLAARTNGSDASARAIRPRPTPEPRARAPSPDPGRRPRHPAGARAGSDGAEYRRQDRRAQDGRAPAAHGAVGSARAGGRRHPGAGLPVGVCRHRRRAVDRREPQHVLGPHRQHRRDGPRADAAGARPARRGRAAGPIRTRAARWRWR